MTKSKITSSASRSKKCPPSTSPARPSSMIRKNGSSARKSPMFSTTRNLLGLVSSNVVGDGDKSRASTREYRFEGARRELASIDQRVLLSERPAIVRQLVVRIASLRGAVNHEIQPTTVRSGSRCSKHGIHQRSTGIRRPTRPGVRAAGWDAMPTHASGLRAGERHAVFGLPARHQRRVHAESGGLPVAYWVTPRM